MQPIFSCGSSESCSCAPVTIFAGNVSGLYYAARAGGDDILRGTPKYITASTIGARDRLIVIGSYGNFIYREMEHLVAFVAGNADKSSEFKKIYAAENVSIHWSNRAHCLIALFYYLKQSLIFWDLYI